MRDLVRGFSVSVGLLILLAVPAAAQGTPTPGETSGSPLAPLLVTHRDPATGDMRLSYQTGCGTTDNNIYVGPLDQVSGLAWSHAVCDIGTSGGYGGFNPGPGSYFFVVVGNDDVDDGSYGRSSTGSMTVERPPFSASTCGQVQNLANTCAPAPQGAGCVSSADCGSRQKCVDDATGPPRCDCLDPFGGSYCESCAAGYDGPDCRECEAGFASNEMQELNGDDVPQDPTAPETFRCDPDVPGDCSGMACSGRGTCAVAGRDAICACDEGYTGADCQECAPSFERDAGGACVLGLACRTAKCGGNGDCVALPFGDLACTCDRGFSGVDCGGPPMEIATTAETLTLYDGETVVLEPRGGTGPYTWELISGPARVLPCPTSGGPTCPVGGTQVTIVAPSGGLPDLELVQVNLNDGAGNSASQNLAALPPTVVPFTGELHSELFPYYRAMLKYMRARGIRAGVLGISKGGQIVGTNGYGYRDAGIDADPFVNAGEGGPLVQPSSPFRIASVSKPLTAAVLRDAAADAGVNITSSTIANRAATWIQASIGFSLVSGAPPFDYNLDAPLTTDSRWANLTIQHLLNHHVGFWRDQVLPSTNGHPAYDAGKLPNTEALGDPSDFQTARTGTSSDISYATMYAVAALELQFDPRPTVANMIRFVGGNKLQYNPGGSTAGGDNYANIGYIMAGRAVEGLRGETYDPDEPGVPSGWGKFPMLLRDYLCESSGILSGIYPGDAFNPQALEPYYRDLNKNGVESMEWNLAQGAQKIRWNAGIAQWQFCQSNCPDLPGAVWNDLENTPSPYGGIWLGERNGAGGIVATTSALLRFARNHRVKVGTPNEGATGTGSLLPGPGSYGSGSSHNGSLTGTRSWLWQLGGFRTNQVPDPVGAWNDDPSAPLPVDLNGNVVVTEVTKPRSCNLPSDVAVAVMFNQRQDRRAPSVGSVGASNGTVYGRIIDFLGDATCEVQSNGWPALAEPGAQVAILPPCN